MLLTPTITLIPGEVEAKWALMQAKEDDWNEANCKLGLSPRTSITYTQNGSSHYRVSLGLRLTRASGWSRPSLIDPDPALV